MWYLYILRCGDGSYYTGSTHDLAHRLGEHQSGRGAAYTRSHLPVELVAAWRYGDHSSALRAERRFKGLPRDAKLTWIEGRWPFMGAPFAFEAVGEVQGHHFCPCCGGPLKTPAAQPPAVQVCGVCKRPHYRNAKPCAGVVIMRNHHVLLVRRAFEPGKGLWDIPGGFLEEAELPELGAQREAQEETGLEVRLLDFLGFYLDTYLFHGEQFTILNIYFVADARGEPLPGDDADLCAWFPLMALPETMAFAHEMQVLGDLRLWAARRGQVGPLFAGLDDNSSQGVDLCA